ncbi:hypothetical protein EY916_10405 [Citrobacter braakii]|nr:hypothetical protein EY916_10405 [Citrobacter braakii]
MALRREPPLIARFPFPLLRFSFSRRRVIFNFSEVAQRRRRVFVVASARDDFYPAAVLFEFDGVRRDIAPGTEQTIMPTLPGAGKLRRHGEKKDDAKDKQTANSQKNYAKLRKKTANSESVKREKLIDAYRLAGANAKGLQRL